MLDSAARFRLALVIGLNVVLAFLEVLAIGLVVPFISLISEPEKITQNKHLHILYDIAGVTTPHQFLILFGICLFALILVKNVYAIGVTRFQTTFSYDQVVRIGGQLFGRYLAAPYTFHLVRNSASLVTTLVVFVETVFTTQVLLMAIMFFVEFASVVAIIILLLVVEPRLTLVLGFVLGGCAFGIARFARQETVSLGETVARLQTERVKRLQQAFGSIKDVIVLGRETFFVDEFSRVNREFAEAMAQTQILRQVPRPLLEIIVTGGLVLVVVLILWQGRATTDIISVLGLFAMAAFRVLPGINRLVYAYQSIKGGDAIVDAVASDMHDPRLHDPSAAPAPERLHIAKRILLDGVSFTYEGKAGYALDDITLEIRRGEAIGLVGASGAGKSTLVDVLLGLLRVQRGSVTVDEIDIGDDPRAWRQTIGYVPQSISLIDDSLRNNVAFGIEARRIDDRHVWKALALARLDDYVRELPGGLDTVIGERGVRLSGGQRQRIGIARALYHDPDVLILDEATSALDNESERQITEAIEGLHGEKTLIAIAHRLSTVKHCDRLVMMREGRIVGVGSFEELVARNPEFRHMVQLATVNSGDLDLPVAGTSNEPAAR